MPDRPRKKRHADAKRHAWEIVREATGEKPKSGEDATAAIIEAEMREGKDPAAVLPGRRGGKRAAIRERRG